MLAGARVNRHRLVELPQRSGDPYACQRALVSLLLDHYGGNVIGYKVACTNPIAQRQLGVAGPFYGHLLSPFCFDSPARLRADQFFMRVIEAEFAFLIGEGGAIEGVLPAIEIVDSRFTSWTTMGAPSLISDNACNGAWVKGPLCRDWKTIDLAAQRVQLLVNDQVVAEGSGAAVLGHPLNVLRWLVDALGAHGLSLQAGQYVTTGVTTDIYMAEAGDRIIADFGPVGRAELSFE